jgi:hypothetical protein
LRFISIVEIAHQNTDVARALVFNEAITIDDAPTDPLMF